MKKILLSIILLLSVVAGYSQQKIFIITGFGAIADGQTLNTLSIQNAIDKAAAAGGGKVIVPKGRFVTGVIYLKTGVELHLEKEAVLLGSTNRLDYGKDRAGALITANHQNRIAITGPGEIDGRGGEVVKDLIQLLKQDVLKDDQWKEKRPSESNRPKIIAFTGCSDIIVKGVTVKNSAAWVQDYVRCNNVIIDSVTVISTAYWNNDGIDIVNSKNVCITNCNVDAADDAIALKSEGDPGYCENIYVGNCTLRSSANAFKLGTGSHGGFRNITVRYLTIYDTYRSAIALESVDGGFLENVDIQHVKATNTGNAVFIRLGHRNKDSNYSTVKDIRIADIYVEVPAGKPDKGYPLEGPGLAYPPGIMPPAQGEPVQSISPWNDSGSDRLRVKYLHNVFPSSITGLPGHPVENITLENIEIVYAGGANKRKGWLPVDSLSKITEATGAYPEFSMFGELPCWGLYVRHANNIRMKNVKLSFQDHDFRQACIFDDVDGLILEKLTILSYKELPIVILNNVRKYSTGMLSFPVEEKKAVKIQ